MRLSLTDEEAGIQSGRVRGQEGQGGRAGNRSRISFKAGQSGQAPCRDSENPGGDFLGSTAFAINRSLCMCVSE